MFEGPILTIDGHQVQKLGNTWLIDDQAVLSKQQKDVFDGLVNIDLTPTDWNCSEEWTRAYRDYKQIGKKTRVQLHQDYMIQNGLVESQPCVHEGRKYNSLDYRFLFEQVVENKPEFTRLQREYQRLTKPPDDIEPTPHPDETDPNSGETEKKKTPEKPKKPKEEKKSEQQAPIPLVLRVTRLETQVADLTALVHKLAQEVGIDA